MSTTPHVQRASATRCIVGENPLWHPEHNCLYFCDIPQAQLLRYHPATSHTEIVRTSTGALGGFTIEHDGALTLFLDGGRIHRWTPQEESTLLSGIPREASSRFNDVIADPRGRVFCGTMRTPNQLGALYRIDNALQPQMVCENLGCSNGLAFTANNQYLYLVDSHARTVSRFDYDSNTGNITNRRNFLHFAEDCGVPDGMTLDAEDHLWIAFWNGAHIARFSPSGEEVARYELPTPKVSSLTFGGEDYRTLFITTASIDIHEDTNKNDPHAGALYTLRPGVQGRPEFRSRLTAVPSE